MKTSTGAVLLASQISHVFSAPVTPVTNVLVARADAETCSQEGYNKDDKSFTWNNCDDDGKKTGDVQITFGDGKMEYGHLVPSSTLSVIQDECGQQTSCKPDQTFKHTAWIVNSDRGYDYDIEMRVDGTWNLEGQKGSLSQLLELAKKGMENLYEQGAAELTQGVSYVKADDLCPAWQTRGCVSHHGKLDVNDSLNDEFRDADRYSLEDSSGYTDQWKSTDHLTVRVNKDGDGGLAGEINISWKPATDASAGICESLTVAGVAGGLANAVAGSAVVIAGVFCSLFTG